MPSATTPAPARRSRRHLGNVRRGAAAVVPVGIGRSVRPSAWWSALAALVLVRLSIPLGALAASGSDLPGLPRYTYRPLNGDAFGYYAGAREAIPAAPGERPPRRGRRRTRRDRTLCAPVGLVERARRPRPRPALDPARRARRFGERPAGATAIHIPTPERRCLRLLRRRPRGDLGGTWGTSAAARPPSYPSG